MKYRKLVIFVIVAILVMFSAVGCFASEQPVVGADPDNQTSSTSDQPQDTTTPESQTEKPKVSYSDEYDDSDIFTETTYEEVIRVHDEYIETPDSTAFIAIAYYPEESKLWVQFRKSGVSYVYYGVPLDVWDEFKSADSKGGYFNDYIKGVYEYDRE